VPEALASADQHIFNYLVAEPLVTVQSPSGGGANTGHGNTTTGRTSDTRSGGIIERYVGMIRHVSQMA
jgi:hypothetical protein